MSSDPTQQAQNAASAMKTIVDLAADHPEFKQAGTNLAKSAKTITALVNNCLLPIAAVNYGFERGRRYFQDRFPAEFARKVESIPPENLQEPKASIASQILQGLTFAHDEVELKELYLNLLKQSMDSRVSSQSHPAYVEILRQITSEEARLLNGILRSDGLLPIVEVRRNVGPTGGYQVLRSNIMSSFDTATKKPVIISDLSAKVDNWCRLGLITVSYERHLTDDRLYAWVKEWPEYLELVSPHPDGEAYPKNGVLTVTSFGKAFARAVAD